MLDEVGAKMRREGILSALESMKQLKAKREEQERLLGELRYGLCHSFIWPEAYAEKPAPKVTFEGAGGANTFKLVLVSEPLKQTREIRFRVHRSLTSPAGQGARDDRGKYVQANWPVPPARAKWCLSILTEEFKDIPIEVFGVVVNDYLEQVSGANLQAFGKEFLNR